MVFVELIGAFIVILSIIYIYYKYVIFNFWSRRGVFYVKPVVPTGNIAALITGKVQVGIFFRDAYMKYKNYRAFGMYSLFKPNLLIADPELIRLVLTKEFESFHDRGMYCNEKIDPLTGHLFLMSGKRWRNMRVKLTPTFTTGRIKQMFSIIKECGNKLADYLDRQAQMRESIEIKDILSRYTTDVIMSTAFGINSNCIEEPNNEYRIQGKKVFYFKSLWIALFMFVPQIMNFFSIPLTNRSVTNFYMNIFRQNVEYRQAHNIVRHDFMNLLIQLMEKGYLDPDDDEKTNEAAVDKLTMIEATAQSYVFFIAGFESSSMTTAFTLYELAQREDIQNKLRKEIDEVLSEHGGLTYDAVNNMIYLSKVIKETLRKYPPLPILNRICTEEIVLPTTDIRIPKGTIITIPVLGLHQDPSIYPNPDTFDPERFNLDEVAKRHRFAYLAFGEGPRNCIGKRFGYIETKIGLVCLLAKYKFKIHPRTQIPLVFNPQTLGLAPKGGIHLIIEPR
ncbi:probable cytochrome P450 6a14 [Solenopsis invicta]|uniref:probable cytochrome P450 6a14 n=1 Tax=Solenopsis invicta TaxID=13686 RepID=UPI00193CB80B|nr:probable cytochrome P450 6a14 [Solenopsis invicta]XP_039312726.1 probable cytochrome P450 6a14 [Solenopsis invicta]